MCEPIKPVAPVIKTVLGGNDVMQDTFEGEEARSLPGVEIGEELAVG